MSRCMSRVVKEKNQTRLILALLRCYWQTWLGLLITGDGDGWDGREGRAHQIWASGSLHSYLEIGQASARAPVKLGCSKAGPRLAREDDESNHGCTVHTYCTIHIHIIHLDPMGGAGVLLPW